MIGTVTNFGCGVIPVQRADMGLTGEPVVDLLIVIVGALTILGIAWINKHQP